MNEKFNEPYKSKISDKTYTRISITILTLFSIAEFRFNSGVLFFLKFHPAGFMIITFIFSKLYYIKLNELNNKIDELKNKKDYIFQLHFEESIVGISSVAEINRLIEKLEDERKDNIKYCVQSIISAYLILECATFKFITISGITDVSHFSKNSSYFMIGVIGAFVTLFPYFIQPFNWFIDFMDENNNLITYMCNSFIVDIIIVFFYLFILELMKININVIPKIFIFSAIILALIIIEANFYKKKRMDISYMAIRLLFYLFFLLLSSNNVYSYLIASTSIVLFDLELNN